MKEPVKRRCHSQAPAHGSAVERLSVLTRSSYRAIPRNEIAVNKSLDTRSDSSIAQRQPGYLGVIKCLMSIPPARKPIMLRV